LSILVFSDNPGVEETQMVLRELRKREMDTDFLSPWHIHFPKFIDKYYGVVYVPANMLHRGSTFELSHRLMILQRLEKDSEVINHVDSMVQYSKEHLTLKLEEYGFPHPRTLITESIDEAITFSQNILDDGGEVVIKPIGRARGIGVIRLRSIWIRGDLNQYLAWYLRNQGQGVFYLQEFVPNNGYDIRCMVVGGEVVGREKRSNPEDFRYNVAAGGVAEAYNDPRYDELAVEVAEIVGLEITGIDILPSEEGDPYILEANAYPGYKALIESTGIEIHQIIADYLIWRLNH
jgi:RimK family alpha-L-glutamate ligase